MCSLWQTGQKQGPGEGWGHRAGAHGFFWQRMEPSWGREVTLPLPMSSHPQTRPHVASWGCAPTDLPGPDPLPQPRRPEPNPVLMDVTGSVYPGRRRRPLSGQRGGSRDEGLQAPKGPPHLAGADGAGGVERVRKGLSGGGGDPMIEASWQRGEYKAEPQSVDSSAATRTDTNTDTHTHTHTHTHTAGPGVLYQSLAKSQKER